MFHIIVTPTKCNYILAETTYIADRNDAIARAEKCKSVWANHREAVEIRVITISGETIHTVV